MAVVDVEAPQGLRDTVVRSDCFVGVKSNRGQYDRRERDRVVGKE